MDYKLYGECTRKVFFEKHFTKRKKLILVLSKCKYYKLSGNDAKFKVWRQLLGYYDDHFVKFDRMISKILNETNV